MKFRFFFISILLILSALDLTALEMNVGRDYLNDSKSYEDDYLFIGNQLSFSGEARDLFAFGEQLEISGNTELAVTALGRDVEISGAAGNGVKAAGQRVILKGDTKGTSFLAGEEVILDESGSISGTTLIGARKISIKGKMNGNLKAGAGEITIENEIQGNVTLHTGRLRIADQGRIVGNLIYHSDEPISDEEALRVTGNITFKEEKGGHFDDTTTGDLLDHSIWFSVFFKLSFAVLGLLLLLFPVGRVLEKRFTRKDVLSHSLWGLIPIFIYPSAIVISMILVITIPLGIALILGFIPVLFITKLIGVTIMGGFIANLLNLNTQSRFAFYLIGITLYSLLSFIPIVGILLLVFVSSIGCGWLLSILFQKKLA